MDYEKIYKNSPLYSALGEHLSNKRHSMHTPGHKGKAPLLSGLSLERDLTELPDTDSLYTADGAIMRAEALATAYFGGARTVFSAGGCTLAIQAMLRCACSEGDKIILDRRAHLSAVNACALLDLEPIWLIPEREEGGAGGRVTAAAVRTLLERNPGTKAVYITSPDYCGRLSDIEAISRECKRFNALLLVDNAHGAHLRAFGLHPLQLGASLCSCSAHKTLPVLTGGAFLSCSDEKFAALLKPAMSLFGSTSPSFLTMQSLDLCRSWLENGGERELIECAKKVDALKKAAIIAGYALPTGSCDPLRLTLLTRKKGTSGYELARLLRESGIEPEHCDEASVILLCSPFDEQEAYDSILRALQREPVQTVQGDEKAFVLPERALSPRQAALSETEKLAPALASGRISAQALCVCPPGVPIVMPGEIITDSIISEAARAGLGELLVVKKEG